MKLFDKLFKGRQVNKSIDKEEIQQPINGKSNSLEYGIQRGCCENC